MCCSDCTVCYQGEVGSGRVKRTTPSSRRNAGIHPSFVRRGAWWSMSLFLFDRRSFLNNRFYRFFTRRTVLIHTELRQNLGPADAEGLKLLEQVKDQGRAGLGKAIDAAVAVAVSAALVDHYDLVDLAERFGDSLENRSGRFDDRGKLFKYGLQPGRVVEFAPSGCFFLDGGCFG